MDRRWLGVAGLICLLCSNMQQPSWFRGAFLPILALVLFVAAAISWISTRVSSVARDQSAYIPTAEEREAIARMRQQAKPATVQTPQQQAQEKVAALQAKLAAIRAAESSKSAVRVRTDDDSAQTKPDAEPSV
jgi:F0F1-type ATP synthase membrane subunit b/b'